MLFVLTVLTAGYFAGVFWVRREMGRQRPVPASGTLPEADRPPASAVGWPPEGGQFSTYLDDGVATLHAYLEEGSSA